MPGHVAGRRNDRRDYKVSINRPPIKKSAPAGAGTNCFHNQGREAPHFLGGCVNSFLKKVGEFIKMGSWKPHKIRLRDSESIYINKGRFYG